MYVCITQILYTSKRQNKHDYINISKYIQNIYAPIEKKTKMVQAKKDENVSERTQAFIDVELKHAAHNYHPIPAVLSRGKGAIVWDVDDKEYLDFLAAYGAVNQGHCHPRIVDTMIEQSQTLTLSSRAFHNDIFGSYAKFVTSLFGYDKVLPMNTGVEAGETAVKICRKWGYMKKKIENNKAKVLFCNNNFWGRSIAALSSSTDPDCYNNFGPYTPGFELIEYNNLDALSAAVKDPCVCGFYVEPIQGEAGVIVPDNGYLKKAYDICKQNNVLFVADEIQSGLGRTGTMLACEHDNVRPDIIVLAKALSGGVMPVSAVLCDDHIMSCIQPGQHGSTYGGNPLACRVAMTALQVIKDEELCENATKMGHIFDEQLKSLTGSTLIKEIRGRGLMKAIQIKDGVKVTAWDVCIQLKNKGLLCKPTHEHTIRFTPPLCIQKEQILKACEIIIQTFKELEKQN